MIDELGTVMSSAINEVKFEGGISESEIFGPALQGIPIAIFA